MEALLFTGQYEVSIDKKSRMVLPAGLRQRIKPESHGKDFYLLIGHNKRPWLYPDLYYEHLQNQEKLDPIPGIEQTDYDLMALAMADRVELDGQGRILIPARTFEWTGIQKEQPLTLLGVREHLELWDREDWNRYRKTLLERSAEVAQRARQARQDQ